MTRIEWPTLGFLALAYCVWAAALWFATISIGLAVVVAALAITLHASLQHEVIHGHPFRNAALNTALVWPPLTVFVPYLRFRDTHLAHHSDCDLTDPYDDPETNYLDPKAWAKKSPFVKAICLVNNTLLGRILIGPILGTASFFRSDWGSRGLPEVRLGWLWHIPAVLAVLAFVFWSPMPIWAYLVACYIALSLLRIRTFLEHRAHTLNRARSVIVEDRGPLAVLFLNNNLHAVHHMYPSVAWYRLPKLLRDNRDRFLSANDGYHYTSYFDVFRRHLLKRKDPVAHPLWQGPKD